MLKRTAFQVDLRGIDAEQLRDAAESAFEAAAAADREGGEKNRGTIVCQLVRTPNGVVTIRGQFMPRKYAERIVAVFDDFSKDLREQDRQLEPTKVEL